MGAIAFDRAFLDRRGQGAGMTMSRGYREVSPPGAGAWALVAGAVCVTTPRFASASVSFITALSSGRETGRRRLSGIVRT